MCNYMDRFETDWIDSCVIEVEVRARKGEQELG